MFFPEVAGHVSEKSNPHFISFGCTSFDWHGRRETAISPAHDQKVAPDGTIQKIQAFTPDLIRQGNINLNIFCSRCHGKDGRGGKGPDLTDGVFRHAQTDREIIDLIANGIPGTGMPGSGEAAEDFHLPILAYMRCEVEREIICAEWRRRSRHGTLQEA